MRDQSTAQGTRTRGDLIGSFTLAYLLCGVLLTGLLMMAGVLKVMAGTRFLDVLIEIGIVKYRHGDMGLFKGLESPLLYFQTQQAIDWRMVALCAGVYLLFNLVKAVQFHRIARLYELSGTFGEHVRAYFYGQGLNRVLPFAAGDTATVKVLEGQGEPRDRAASVLYIQDRFVDFEVGFFLLTVLIFTGWTQTTSEVFGALLFTGVLWLVMRHARPVREKGLARPGMRFLRAMAREPLTLVGLGALSLVAFMLDELTPYIIAQAFTSDHLNLSIELIVLHGAIVAGYIASRIPITPGAIGQFELGFVLALVASGESLAIATTIAVLSGVLRHSVGIALMIGARVGSGIATPFRTVMASFRGLDAPLVRTDPFQTAAGPLPVAELPHFSMVPRAGQLWSKAMIGAWVAAAIFFWDEAAELLATYWLLDGLGLDSVFWTNFAMGSTLFAAGFAIFAAAVFVPALVHRVGAAPRRLALRLAIAVGLVAGYQLCLEYQGFLLLFGHVPFESADPYFGRDIGFYVFALPALWTSLWVLGLASVMALVSSVTCAHRAARGGAVSDSTETTRVLANIATPFTRFAVLAIGVCLAAGQWLMRYEVLTHHNKKSAVHNGADIVDIEGVFSTVVDYSLTATLILVGFIILTRILAALRASATGSDWQAPAMRWAKILLVIVAVDFAFKGLVAVRESILVRPNEPVIQIPYIQEHIRATRDGFGLASVESVPFTPRAFEDPLPDPDALMASATLRDAPLWPGFSTYLARIVRPEHAQRINQTAGDSMVYGPTLEVLQQRKLRPYYRFLGVDPVRYQTDGELRMFVSAVRELPVFPEGSLEASSDNWLKFWGQRQMLFTHGYGLAAAEVGTSTADGTPSYLASGDLADDDAHLFGAKNPRIYYGEGAGVMAFSNMLNVKEFDFPTDEGRAELLLSPDVDAGVPVDSLLKRIVFGWRSGQVLEVVFSRLIGPETRAHYERRPIDRLLRIAPFLYWETNPWAVVADGEILWMANGITHSDWFPNSARRRLGARETGRVLSPDLTTRVNYLRDSVKATVDALTGAVRLYRISDEPIARSWEAIYPDLFAREPMPASVREQLQYPVKLMEIQFADVYRTYQMDDPMTYYNLEDPWRKADEVIGPILDQGQAISFDLEQQHWLAETTGNPLPKSSEPVQFVMSMVFTPEETQNLRAIPIVYQGGEDYGRLISLQIPKGIFAFGPAQADAAIDQEPEISGQIAWWNRKGTDVIRGHTSTLVLDGEVIYVEPLFIRSQQNAVTQMKKVIVVFRGRARMGDTLDEALRRAIQAVADDQKGKRSAGSLAGPAREPGVPSAGAGAPLYNGPDA